MIEPLLDRLMFQLEMIESLFDRLMFELPVETNCHDNDNDAHDTTNHIDKVPEHRDGQGSDEYRLARSHWGFTG